MRTFPISPAVAGFFKRYYRILLCFAITVCSVRVYEYYGVASKSFVDHPLLFEFTGLLYDIWACFIYSVLFLLPYFLFSRIHKKLATVIFHLVNIILLICYVSLIVVFSERTKPFDHEFFTRKAADTWVTTKQMMAGGFHVYVPFIIYLLIYLIICFYNFKKINIGNRLLVFCMTCSLLFSIFFKFSNPPEHWFKQQGQYHLACNKMSFWVADSYKYLTTKDLYDASKLNNKELEAAIDFYQKNQPFEFTGKEYPLMHKNTGEDVLGSFFNLDKDNPPNIVILVGEGLSRDFSGNNAYASSFTPFLDSLSQHSLTWDNFLSTAPATFAAHPAIEGSLPYGRRGFSAMNIMPDHLSLIKILRANGYKVNFMIGFDPDFDNMGGFIRLQGTDMVLSKYGPKYKQMGVGAEGWTMGYPDDALFSRSFEVMDSLKESPYLNIYHTATTHMPYLFEQSSIYDRLFDKKMQTINVAPNIKKTLKSCKKVLVTFMFADDCFRDFFKKYAQRPEYKNTIFFITGDHHIGSFPSTGTIDDYHVPLIIYSPMLKAPQRFLSVNSHNNLAPTITNLILSNYKLPYTPAAVHWLGGVLDTCRTFRNIQSMPFMAWSREMNDYIYKDYMLSEGELYKLTPTLQMLDYENDSLKKHMTDLLNNFKVINSYVCGNNKIFPAKDLVNSGERTLLLDYKEEKDRLVFDTAQTTILMPKFKIPPGYTSLYVELTADTKLIMTGGENQPSFTLSIIDTSNRDDNYLYTSDRDVVLMAKGEYVQKEYNTVSTNDMFTLNDYKDYKNLVFSLGFYTATAPINLRLKNLTVKIFGIK